MALLIALLKGGGGTKKSIKVYVDLKNFRVSILTF